jgi:DNA invertase Pin-like site-specific DNA recombinase
VALCICVASSGTPFNKLLRCLARDLMIQETILADLQKRGHTLISAHEPDLCRDDPSRTLMRQIFGAIAGYDRAMIVLKLRGARQRIKSKIGRCEGVKPFGHDPKRPDEGLALAAILACTDCGMTCEGIAHQMNARRVRTRTGKPWRGTTIAKIVRRETRHELPCSVRTPIL